MTRALASKDRRYAQILGKLGYSSGDVEVEEDLTTLRAEYKAKIGKQAYHGWDAATLRAKMAEAK
ncbi:hypothetical protein WJT74_05130 [Sphingomicrobium sp. XHP0239]|uniref:hypothetical protein n=1 Tax=Sphingomicrobium maritimum TaxID=3133972 RepID=UPI0031CC42A2